MILDELKIEISNTLKKTKKLENAINLSEKSNIINQLEEKTTAPDFWNDAQKAKEISKKLTNTKNFISEWNSIKNLCDDMETMIELIEEDPDDIDLLKELETTYKKTNVILNAFELKTLLSGKYDSNNTFFSIHPGAGGTESQDWAQMLVRMYCKWFELNGFKYETIDMQPGEVAGIKSLTLKVNGEYAYGFLKGEKGIHRLVRISPFDSNKRRHTSFASVDIFPEIDDEIDMEINDNDLRIDTYRASGAGGQHINKTDSAVRITHIPTKIVTQCQSQRSQHSNKATAMNVLKARLYEYYQKQQEKEINEIKGEKMDIAWGSQIRSYVFHPYNMVKDHRTNVETGNIQAVMDGSIDIFIQGFLFKTLKTNS